jgi:hypothetical protein
MKNRRWLHVLTIFFCLFLTGLSGFRNSFYKPLRFPGSALNGVRRGKLFRSKFVSEKPSGKQDTSKSNLDESATSILTPTNTLTPTNRFKIENDEEADDSLNEADEDDVGETDDEDDDEDDDDESEDGEIDDDLEGLTERLEKGAFDSVNKHLEKVFAIDTGKRKKNIPTVSVPEEEDCIGTKFHRKVHISQIPRRKTTVCRLVANETERLYLAKKEFEIPQLDYFAANMSLSFKDPYTLEIIGRVEGKITLFNLDISETFTTLLLCNHGNKIPKNLESEETYHDAIPADGFLDVGSIACDYFRFGLG